MSLKPPCINELGFDEFLNQFDQAQVNAWERAGTIPRAVIEALASTAMLGLTVPHDFGGRGLNAAHYGVLCAEVAQLSMSLLSILTVHTMAIEGLQLWGSASQKAEWLPKLASGDAMGAFALTESAYGSEATGVETTLTAVDNGFVLSGEKNWISYAQCADVFLVFAQTTEQAGASVACLLPASTPGLVIEPIDDMMGFAASGMGRLIFNDCPVPSEHILGRPGMGIPYVASSVLDLGRFSIAWGCVGAMEALIADAGTYALSRRQYGQPIAKHQLIQRLLTNVIVDHKSGLQLCLHAASLRDQKDPAAAMETTVAKYFASRHAVAAAGDALQIQGARGFSKNFGRIERLYRDLKVTEIIEGSNEMQQMMIADNGLAPYVRDHKRRLKMYKSDAE